LEDILWERFIEKKIEAERQFFILGNEKSYFLDFAIFCKTRNINVECDGDKYHTEKFDVQYDKDRNNLLESKGWAVLRFTTQNLTKGLDDSVNLVCEAINKYGGVQDVDNLDSYNYKRPDNNPQLSLFD
jgi:very-short-patch-repair endonuclease